MLPWHSYPYPTSGTEGGGGAEDLQTDVMRFMAMLGLCLVAIFALVQSLPATPVASETLPEAGSPAVGSAQVARPAPLPVTRPKREVERPSQVSTPEPPPTPDAAAISPPVAKLAANGPMAPPSAPPLAPADVLTATPPPLKAPLVPAHSPAPPARLAQPSPAQSPITEELTPPPSVAPSAPAPMPTAPSPPPSTPAFTLRFVDASALLALVQREAVSLFAVDGRGTSRLSAARGRYAFEITPAPSQMHEMDPASVPAQVRSAYARTRGQSADAVRRWGVVLPTSTRRAIDELLRDPRGGELQISADGQVRLVPDRSVRPVPAYPSIPLVRGAS
ncbi:MAG: hypothetical protein AAGA68_18615 [Pseudomonadota bacterium]